jgi:hypothetical protein
MRAFLLLCALAIPPAGAAPCSVDSGDARNRLLELYTSEGCSSCPPADRWLSQPPSGSRVVPLAFHVDYWDRLGWRDPFAQAAFTQRQRSRNAGRGWIYTPQVMLDGADLRAWHRGLPAPAAERARVAIALTLAPSPGQIAVDARLRFVEASDGEEARVYLALTESRLVSSVTAGENAQRTLHHDHVVRSLAGPFAPRAVRHRFALHPDWKTRDLAVAAFVLDAAGSTLQAVSGRCVD